MAQLDPDVVGAIVGVPGIILFTFLILRFKLKKKELEMRGGDLELRPELDALRDDLADLKEHTRAELAELQERLDFTERVLSEVRSRNVIGPGDST